MLAAASNFSQQEEERRNSSHLTEPEELAGFFSKLIPNTVNCQFKTC